MRRKREDRSLDNTFQFAAAFVDLGRGYTKRARIVLVHTNYIEIIADVT